MHRGSVTTVIDRHVTSDTTVNDTPLMPDLYRYMMSNVAENDRHATSDTTLNDRQLTSDTTDNKTHTTSSTAVNDKDITSDTSDTNCQKVSMVTKTPLRDGSTSTGRKSRRHLRSSSTVFRLDEILRQRKIGLQSRYTSIVYYDYVLLYSIYIYIYVS